MRHKLDSALKRMKSTTSTDLAMIMYNFRDTGISMDEIQQLTGLDRAKAHSMKNNLIRVHGFVIRLVGGQYFLDDITGLSSDKYINDQIKRRERVRRNSELKSKSKIKLPDSPFNRAFAMMGVQSTKQHR